MTIPAGVTVLMASNSARLAVVGAPLGRDALRDAMEESYRAQGALLRALHDASFVGWVERSDTHRSCIRQAMNLAFGSTHPAGLTRPSRSGFSREPFPPLQE